jgi:CheY-specific phosphatase CheX
MMLAEEVSKPEARFDASTPVLLSWVEMKGSFEGAVSILTQEGFLRTLAANLLGMAEGDVTPEDEKDAFREMGNVLAGNFLTEAYGTDLAFDVTPPQVNEVSYAEFEKASNRPVSFFFVADELPVMVSFSIREKV